MWVTDLVKDIDSWLLGAQNHLQNEPPIEDIRNAVGFIKCRLTGFHIRQFCMGRYPLKLVLNTKLFTSKILHSTTSMIYHQVIWS